MTGVVVAGYSQTSKQSGALYDESLTIKYDASGNEQWVRRRSTAQISDHAEDVVVDSTGNAYVTGFSLTAPGAGQTLKNFVTVKYSPEGQELWASSFNERDADPGPQPLPNNPTTDEPGHIALDSSGNLYVAGTNQPGATGPDYLLLKLNPATGALVWKRNWAGQSTDNLRDMAVDAGGNIYLAGTATLTNANGDQTTDIVTVKLTPSTGAINSPPQVRVVFGPTIAGKPAPAGLGAVNQGDGPATGPTIAGRSLTINAEASDRDGTVVRVDFYDDANLLGTDNTAPYSFQWGNAPLGTHAIIAAATDSFGATRSSSDRDGHYHGVGRHDYRRYSDGRRRRGPRQRLCQSPEH